jgi:hypothetical protein
MTLIAHSIHRVAAMTLWGLVILVVASLVGTGETSAQGTNHAAIVVDFGGGQLTSSCVPFAEDEISGAELLRRSGATVVFTGFGGGLGAGVCEIDGQGCNDPGDCFCQCRGADCHYWSYWTLQDGEWHFQNVGASQRDVHDGDADAWVWGDRRTPPDAELGYGDVCPVVVPTNAPLPRPTSSTGGSGDPQPTTAGAGPQPVATSAGGPNAQIATPAATPRATEQVRRETTPILRDGGADAAGTADDASGGPAAGLIAFGVIAGALVLGIGAFAARRRFYG